MKVNMEAVIVSPKYRIVIPRSVRESMNIKPGPKSLRGLLRGIDTKVDREQDRV